MFTYTHHKKHNKGILSNDKTCNLQDVVKHAVSSPRRNASLSFRLKRLQKFRYGVPPFQKVPVWRFGAFRLSLSTAGNFKTFARCRHEDYCYVHELLNSEIFHPLATFELIL